MRYLFLIYLLLLFSCQKKYSQSFLELKTVDKPVESKVISLSGENIFGDNIRILIKPGTNIQTIPYVNTPQIFLYAPDFFVFAPLFIRTKKLEVTVTKDTVISTDTVLLKESKFMKELDVRFNFLGKIGEDMTGWKNKKDYDLLFKRLSSSYKYQLSYVDSIFAVSNYHQDYQSFIRKELRLQYYNSMMETFIYAELDSISDKYIQSLYALKDSIIDLIDTKKGVHNLEKYIVYVYNKFLCRKFVNTPIEFAAQWDTARVVFKNESRDYVLFKLIRDNFFNIRRDVYKYKNEIKNPIFKHFIDSTQEMNNHVFNKNEVKQVLFDSLNNSITLSEILKENKGRMIYIDFWASWCAPCRREMTLYKELNHIFDKNDVNVIFISIDEDKSAWKTSIRKTQTQDYKHYLLPSNSALHKLTNLIEIPRYIIIDKNGKIVDNNAPKPSEKKLLFKQIETVSHK